MEAFPEDITRFLYGNVESIDQLEILRILGEDRQKEWDSIALAAEIQSNPRAVRAHLASMHARGLLVTTARGVDLSCRYGPSSPELEAMIPRLLQVYRERPVTMIKKVYERARDPLQALADAIRIRQGE